MNSRSITFRLAAWHAAIALLACAAFGLYSYLGLRYSLGAVQTAALQRRALEIADILAAHVPREGEAFATALIRTSYAPEHNARFIRIRRPDGSLLYISGSPTDKSFDPAAVPFASSQATTPRHVSGSLLIVQRSAVVDSRPYTIECGVSRLQDARILHGFLAMLALGVPLILLLACSGAVLLVRQALAPLRRLSDAAQAITSSTLGHRLPIASTGDEIEHLSLVLNGMIARIEQAFGHSMRFTADASHELRTPLTIIRIELESLSQDRALHPAAREKLASILEEIERMGKIAEHLLVLSRIDAGEALSHSSRFDLASLAAATAEQIAPLAAEKSILIRCNASEPVEIAGDRLRIQQVIVNLLDNAIKYTPPGGQITIHTSAPASTAILEVADNGPGIPPAALPHVFDRFFRADPARTHTGAGGGAGLGLAIVRSICAAHGGSVQAANRPSGGCRITVRLPLAPPPSRHHPAPPVSEQQTAVG